MNTGPPGPHAILSSFLNQADPVVGRTLIAMGMVLVVVGLIVSVAGRFPGTLTWRSGPVRVFVPLGLMVAVSVIGTILLNLFTRR